MAWIRMLHIFGFTSWLCGMTSMALLLLGGVKVKAAGILADAGATLAIVTGVYAATTQSLWGQTWLYAKLALVVVLVIVHILLRVRTRRGRGESAGAFLGAVLVAAAAIIYLVIGRP